MRKSEHRNIVYVHCAAYIRTYMFELRLFCVLNAITKTSSRLRCFQVLFSLARCLCFHLSFESVQLIENAQWTPKKGTCYVYIEEISTEFQTPDFWSILISSHASDFTLVSFFSRFFTFKFGLYAYLSHGTCTWCPFFRCRVYVSHGMARISKNYAQTFLQWEHKNVHRLGRK